MTDIIEGIELNYHSTDRENQEAYFVSKKLGKLITKGSDKHDNNDSDYIDEDFYYISKIELKKLYKKMKESVEHDGVCKNVKN